MKFYLTTVSNEEPQKGQGMDGHYKSMRYVMIGRNETIVNKVSPKMNWFIDTTRGLECKDLKGRVIDASMTLIDHKDNWDTDDFDLVEFSRYEYSISHIRVKKNSVYGPGDWKSSGDIRHFFRCDEKVYKTPTTPGSTQPTKSDIPIFRIILLILLILAVIGWIAWWLISERKTAPEPIPPPPASAPTPAPASTPAPTVENTDSAITPMNSDTTTVRSKDSLTTGSGAV